MRSCDVAIVGGGPAGATAALDLARAGRSVLLIDKAGRIKPCGGAVPPRLLREFAVPESLLCTRVRGARILAPSGRAVEMPIADGGFVGMVDRDVFDEWLRTRAVTAGVTRLTVTFKRLERREDGTVALHLDSAEDGPVTVTARAVIGADGARSAVACQAMPEVAPPPSVFAYHEIVRAPEADTAQYRAARCDVWYRGDVSPDFYGWVFPHGGTASIGVGTAVKGFALREATSALRARVGLDTAETVRTEGAPIPLRPAARWDDGRNVVLCGDAAGCVAPASGEGIYYAMASGRFAGEAVEEMLATGDARALATARKRFLKAHGRVFWILGIMQRFWYATDRRRERFVSICADPDVQALTWQSYMNKELTRRDPAAHMRIFFKDLAHLFGLVRP